MSLLPVVTSPAETGEVPGEHSTCSGSANLRGCDGRPIFREVYRCDIQRCSDSRSGRHITAGASGRHCAKKSRRRRVGRTVISTPLRLMVRLDTVGSSPHRRRLTGGRRRRAPR
ncbi:conserved domain protein [Actinomyces sp. oral taxon 170 str. F0386]|nr:conserved domain protein [Actinomyces sp. oral taxon 170 str. F0386]